MSFPRYPTYKPSGVEWLGEVPEHWEVKPAKRLIGSIEQGWSPQCENYSVDGSEGWGDLKVGCVNGGVFRHTENKWLPVELDPRPELAVLKGDLLVSRANTRELVGSAAVAIQDYPNLLLCDKLYRMKVDSKEARPQFLSYFLGSREARGKIELEASGASDSMLNISQSVILELPCPAPPAYEQAAIATFLDHETGKIDALIAEQQRLIELLQEKRQAVISHAVTKGLNPDAPMKDSGVEWLGEVPEHWEVIQLKWLTPVKRGASPRPIDDPIYFDEQGEYAWVRISDVTESSGRLEDTTQRLSVLGSDLSVKLEPGSLFLSIAGSVGKACITEIKACIHDGFVYFPLLTLSPGYLMLIFESGACFGGLGKLGTQLNLNTDTIGSIYITLPPEESEIERIIQHCSSQVGELHKLSESVRSAISLLQERRSALISAAVTGQIDVRGLVPEAVAA